ncbi:dynein regulatory complex protein 10-like [Nylanderia fulva]|uniref:dynein regulatory complex protein 10-like n=1 Tax=Nylanderia fulva TaxID=613905 RepID=UPI0010FB0152|nr:dynein regulatory complex protein 10-like [Nylanderia fulva]XP_029173448.1 dynein regulatory complex protein 10-like [Nylanderia fulva]XP_029173449.1 dynein regulatory complex protein 10-like [Nylanderia fulva]XP_029173450.1 dynein regulatory complex protein 10-like [Nylanderia fulva]
MSEEENIIAISIIRMEKLLAGISSKLRELIEKRGIETSLLLQEIINLIELFKKCVKSRMKRTSEGERMHVINLHESQTKIAETLSEFEVLQKLSNEQNSNFEIFIRDMVVCINDEEEIMRSIRKTSELEIPREIEESLQKMLIVAEEEEMRMKSSQAEIDSAKCKLYDVMEFNAEAERKLFDVCAKVERKYLDLLAKYDRDIGGFHASMEKLSKDKEIIEAETKNVEDQLSIQRVLYTQYKKEREIALMIAFTKKLDMFRQNRAAKIIQKTWKTYYERISLKKRRKRKK